MSETALFDTAQALRTRIGQVIGGANLVHVGPPLRNEIGQSRVSLFLFHLQANAELRNEQRYEVPSSPQPVSQPTVAHDALPLDLRFLITVFRTPDHTVQPPNELTTLGQIIQVLQAQPTLAGGDMNGQVVRLTPEPYQMEELSRVWGLFPQDVYRTSMVYLASPVFVEARIFPAGPPIRKREHRDGVATDPPDILGRRADEREEEEL